ncbi:gastrin/cholecystokinin type B receptor isoform X1 [Macaca nemestrina]|uniref:Gastrin/cholecystokinin type B receptor n=3 Tax=Cercopithecinae TaxID=9528 RepID=F6YJW9_MACMU|nr:gastrin/cholecystokinin type B receptor isoform X1 [Macaca fascicularis]XP_009185000.1 gastrin/cholecystokinin type B receptor [Papio anubis]XP_014970472.1 gastrin/cholecystokinin type B receptor [Macaca mulatta]XP_050612191.1 gastrin/cholecystokinin type B receptor [Macaca thibetana thibetana]
MELLKLNRSVQGTGPGPGASLCRPAAPLLNSSSVGNLSCEPPRIRGAGTRELELAIRITLYAVIFLMSVGGNVLIIVVLGLSRRLRTVTNAFLLSLAVSDLLLAVACMPFTLLPNLMGTFIFGTVICKAVSYFMGVSVSVSTLSLVAIALERYSAICRPLQARVWQTRSHAARVIVATWLLSGLLMVPYPVYTVVQPVGPRVLQCVHRWPSARVRQTWSVLLLLLLFFIPGVVMAVAYGLISRELYLGLRFDGDSDSGSQSRVRSQGRLPGGAGPGAIHQNGRCRSETGAVGEDSDGCYVQLPRSRPALELSALTAPGPGSRPTQAKLLAKKRVVRMLLVIVVLFFLCWLPVYSANTWRAFDGLGAHRALSGAPISFIHLLSYASACVNPLVYCFMHRRFRQACLETCARCCPRPPRARPRPLPDEDPPTPSIASLSRLSYTTISTLGPG